MTESPAPDHAHPEVQPRRGVNIPPKVIVIAIIVIAAVWFILANRQSTQITMWVATVTAPVWVVLAGTFTAGLITGWLLRRGRKAHRATAGQ